MQPSNFSKKFNPTANDSCADQMIRLQEEINPYVRLAFYNKLGTYWILRERVIYDYELVLFKQGTPTITIENQTYQVRENMMFLFRPGQRHSIAQVEGPPIIQPHVHFDLKLYPDRHEVPINFRPISEMTAEECTHIRPDVLKDLLPSFPSCIELNDPHSVEFLLFDLINTFSHESPLKELQLKWKFMRFFTQLCNEIIWAEARERSNQDELAQSLRLYLENHYFRPVKLSDLREVYHMDVSYLGRIFQQAYGVSLIKFHRSNQIERSKELLQYSNLSITEIAENLGFDDIHSFSRMFKRIADCSPMEYRRLYIQSNGQKTWDKDISIE